MASLRETSPDKLPPGCAAGNLRSHYDLGPTSRKQGEEMGSRGFRKSVRDRRPTGVTVLVTSAICLAASAPPAFAVTDFDLAQPNSLRFSGEDGDDFAGTSAAPAGDVNNDDIDDLIIGAPGANGDEGAAYVVYGDPQRNSIPNLENVGSDGFVMFGDFNDVAGESVSGAGDFNGDGIDDVIVGAPQANPISQQAGAAYVIYGASGDVPDVNLSAVPTGQAEDARGMVIGSDIGGVRLGSSVSAAGLFNAGPLPDVVVGAEGSNAGITVGAAYVLYGQAGDPADVNIDQIGTPGVTARGLGLFATIPGGDGTGERVTGVGDIAGDSRSDIAVGTEFFGGSQGRTYVVYGQDVADPGSPGTSDFFLTDIPAPGSANSRGYVITGESSSGLGSAVGAAGDFNADGRADLIAGARTFGAAEGAAYVVHEATGGDVADLDLADSLPSSTDRWTRIIGDFPSDQLGLGIGSVAGAGDVNGDGIADVIAGSPLAHPLGVTDGAAYVVYGQQTPDPTDVLVSGIADGGPADGRGFRLIRNPGGAGQLGRAVGAAGDADGDGLSEIFVGDQFFDQNNVQGAPDSGTVYIAELPLATSTLVPGIHGFGDQEPRHPERDADIHLHEHAYRHLRHDLLCRACRADADQFAIVNDGCSRALVGPLNDFCTVTARFCSQHTRLQAGAAALHGQLRRRSADVTLSGVGVAQEPDTVIDGPQLTDANPIFTLSSPTAGATFECSLDLAPYSPCRSPVSFTGLAPGLHLLSARASAFGLTDSSPADHFFFVSAQEEVAPPEQGETANLVPISGKVLVDIPHDGLGFIPIEDAVQVPIRTKVDTRNGRVELTTETEDGGTQSADFYDGIFRIRQGKRDDLTVARLLGRQQCTPAAGAGSGRNALASRKRKPSLWGSGSGNFASSGNHGSASVRGTTWLIFEQCGGITGTFVKEGRVAFKNFYTGRTRLVRKGQTAFARPVGLRPR